MRAAVLVVLTVMAIVMAVNSRAADVTSRYPSFTPIPENYGQILMELLLMRQEVHLARLVDTQTAMEATLTGLTNTVSELSAAVVQQRDSQRTLRQDCPLPWSVVGANCLLLALKEQLNWAAARKYCVAMGGDLATFHDANTFAEYIGYVNSVNNENLAVSAWIGGTDQEIEGVWRWVTGEAMPRGPPFWGSKDGYAPEPDNGRSGNCGFLFQPDQYYLHDTDCAYNTAPLCQKPLM